MGFLGSVLGAGISALEGNPMGAVSDLLGLLGGGNNSSPQSGAPQQVEQMLQQLPQGVLQKLMGALNSSSQGQGGGTGGSDPYGLGGGPSALQGMGAGMGGPPSMPGMGSGMNGMQQGGPGGAHRHDQEQHAKDTLRHLIEQAMQKVQSQQSNSAGLG
jgi:hypothetical protein